VLEAVVREMLATLREPIQQYLRDLADAYTLLEFLRQTPDVQERQKDLFAWPDMARYIDYSAIASRATIGRRQAPLPTNDQNCH